jgi:hypothetical protein
MAKTFQIIAKRNLSQAGSDVPVVIEIGVPRRRRVGEWACPYRIRGLGGDRIRYCFGFDAVQALQIVNQAIWRDLEPYGEKLSWVGEPGDRGFFRYYPAYLGTKHARQVEAAIDREIHKEYLRLKRRSARARGGTSAAGNLRRQPPNKRMQPPSRPSTEASVDSHSPTR